MSATQQQLLNAGFSPVDNTGRFQLWTGIDTRPGIPPGESAMIVWDSQSGRYKVCVDIEPNILTAIFGIGSVLNDVIGLVPNSVIPAATKTAMQQQLLSAIKED